MNRAEEWRPISGFDGYEVSSMGRVRSFKGRHDGHRELRQRRDAYGYMIIGLWQGRKQFTALKVHRLVLEAFVGPCPPGLETRHLDSDRTNNRLENLAWGTRLENASDRTESGRHISGHDHAHARLSPADVKEIRALRGVGDAGCAGQAIRGVAVHNLSGATRAYV